jgi:hypothetical protein
MWGERAAGGVLESGTGLAGERSIVSVKLLGIGIVSVGCLAGASIAGYLSLRPDQAAIAPVTVQAEAVQPLPTAVPDPAPALLDASPAATEVVVAQPRPVAPKRREPATVPVEKAPKAAEQAEKPAPVAAAPETVPATPPAAAAAPPAPVVADPPRYVPEPPPVIADVTEPARPQVEELTVEKHSVIGIRLDAAITTRTARVEDRVSATVSRDVTVAGRIAIPAGVRLEGTVVLVEHGGKFRNRPRLGLRFDRMILTDGTRVSLKTDTIIREGDSPTPDAAAKVGGGAVAGAILGGVLGGRKGAAIGTAVGGAGGAAAIMRGDGNESALPAGAPLTVRLTDDVTVTIQR